VNVDQAQDVNCNIPFVAEIRKSVKCSDNPCYPDPVAARAAASVAAQVNETVTTSAADTGSKGLVASIGAEPDVDTTGLTADAEVDTDNVQWTNEPGETIRIEIQTDDHPSETLWSLVDICPGEVMVARGGEYTVPGKLEMDFVLNRKSRYLFSIIDAGEDGMCCKYGPKGSYKVFADGVYQVGGGEFDASDTKTFGSCTEPSTFKPTNAVTTSPTSNPTNMPTDLPSNNPTSVPTNTNTPTSIPTKTPTLQHTSVPTANNIVLIRIEIRYDDFPEDISWSLANTCDGGRRVEGMGSGYGQDLKGTTDTVFDDSIPDGTFEFVVEDSYGDGLCCSQGNGGYTIHYGHNQISSDFRISHTSTTSKETQQFGSSNKCHNNPTNTMSPTNTPHNLPTDQPTHFQTSKASYDSTLGAPKCGTVHSSGICTTSGTGLLTAKKVSGELNGKELPN